MVTEAGFGADMGAEKFFNIKCRAVRSAARRRRLGDDGAGAQAHTGKYRVVPGKPLPQEMVAENPDDVLAGAVNLRRQLANVRAHGVTPVVAVNAFPGDYDSELRAILDVAAEEGARAAVSHHVAKGGIGAADLATAVEEACEDGSAGGAGGFHPLYDDDLPLLDKIDTVARRMYGADGVDLTPLARRQLEAYGRNGFGRLPVCIAKTHLSLSADPSLPGAPTGWRLPVREVRVSAGAGFVYPICGDMRTMPGLSSSPAAEHIDIGADGEIVGLS